MELEFLAQAAWCKIQENAPAQNSLGESSSALRELAIAFHIGLMQPAIARMRSEAAQNIDLTESRIIRHASAELTKQVLSASAA